MPCSAAHRGTHPLRRGLTLGKPWKKSQGKTAQFCFWRDFFWEVLSWAVLPFQLRVPAVFEHNYFYFNVEVWVRGKICLTNSRFRQPEESCFEIFPYIQAYHQSTIYHHIQYIYIYTITYNDYDIKLTTYHPLFTILCHHYIHWFRIIFSFLSIYLSIYLSIQPSIHLVQGSVNMPLGICFTSPPKNLLEMDYSLSTSYSILRSQRPSCEMSCEANVCRAPRPFKLLQATSLTKACWRPERQFLGRSTTTGYDGDMMGLCRIHQARFNDGIWVYLCLPETDYSCCKANSNPSHSASQIEVHRKKTHHKPPLGMVQCWLYHIAPVAATVYNWEMMTFAWNAA